MDLSTLRELVAKDMETIKRESSPGVFSRNIHSLRDCTLHDLVRVTEVAQEAGYSVELTSYGAEGVFWGLAEP